MDDIIVVEQEEQQRQHLWMMNLVKAVIPIAKNFVVEENPFNFYNGYQNLQHSTI
jgi:hypothetical protein